MNKKGFTFIELLAVIIILAIIMVISVPQTIKIIETSRVRAFEDSYKLIEKGIKTQIAQGKFTLSEDCYFFDFDNKNDNYKNLDVRNKEEFISGSVSYCNGETIYNNLSNGKYTITSDGTIIKESSNPDKDKVLQLRQRVYTLYESQIKSAANYYIKYVKQEDSSFKASIYLYSINFKFQFYIVDASGFPELRLKLINDPLGYIAYENITLTDEGTLLDRTSANTYRYFNNPSFEVKNGFYVEIGKSPSNINDYPYYKPYIGKVMYESINADFDDVFVLPSKKDNDTFNNYFILYEYSNLYVYAIVGNPNIYYTTSDKKFHFECNSSNYVYQYKFDDSGNVTYDKQITSSSYKWYTSGYNQDALPLAQFSTFNIKDENGNIVFGKNTTFDYLTNSTKK